MESSALERVKPLFVEGDVASVAMCALESEGIVTRSEDYRFTKPADLILEQGLVIENTVVETAAGEGVVVASFSEFAQSHANIFASHYSKLTSSLYGKEQIVSKYSQKNNVNGSLFALSDATSSDGVVIYLSKGASFSSVVSVGSRMLVILEQDAKCNLTLSYSDNQEGILCSCVEVFMAMGSRLSMVQDFHALKGAFIGSMVASVGKDATFKNISSTLNCDRVRNNIVVNLEQSGSHADLLGVNIASGEQVSDHYTLINHNAAHCTSFELYKNIISDKAIVSFQGNIYVKAGADGTDAQQLSRNLILSDGAKGYSKPHLEIYADDVKCSHAATTGQMDSEALFYIMQRGISEQIARRLQILGFANDVIDRVEDESAKERIITFIEEIL